MLIINKATCIIFFVDDLPPRVSNHTLHLYNFFGCSKHQVLSVLFDNDYTLNVCPLATTVVLGFEPSNFEPFSQTVQAYESICRNVLGTLTLDLQIGSITFPTIFQVLRIPTSFNLLFGWPWIHKAIVIPFFLHQKVKFIHDGGVITVQSTEDTYSTSKPVLEISHSNDNLFPTGFTFDEIQTMEVKQFYKDYMAFPFYEHGSIVVLDMVRSMSFLSGLGLRRRQHGPGEFIVTVDHDTSFNLSFVPIKPDYRYMAFLHNERLRACMLHISFHYLVHPYRMSLTDAFREDHQWT